MLTGKLVSTIGLALLLVVCGSLAARAQGRDVAPSASTQAAPAAAGDCSPNRVGIRTASDSVLPTSATTAENIPSMRVDINVGGTTPSCVIVVFTGEWVMHTNNVAVRAFISRRGGTSNTVYIGRREASVNASFFTTTVQFVFPKVPPGQHFVYLQYQCVDGCTGTSGVDPLLGVRTVTVHYQS